MNYFWIHFIHLLVAAFFIGSVFFEVLIVSPGTGSLPTEVRGKVGAAVGRRARKVMPFVIIILYGAGLGLAWHHRAVLMDPFASSFGTLLSLKILLALSILVHFISVMIMMKVGSFTPLKSRIIHYSVFVQLLAIVFLAKAMFYPW
jgi:hypothetical protein